MKYSECQRIIVKYLNLVTQKQEVLILDPVLSVDFEACLDF